MAPTQNPNPKCISFYSSVVTKAPKLGAPIQTYLFPFPCGTALLPRCHQKCRVLTRKCSRIVSFHQLAAFTTKPISNIVSCSKKFKHSLLLREIQEFQKKPNQALACIMSNQSSYEGNDWFPFFFHFIFILVWLKIQIYKNYKYKCKVIEINVSWVGQTTIDGWILLSSKPRLTMIWIYDEFVNWKKRAFMKLFSEQIGMRVVFILAFWLTAFHLYCECAF